ncbi:MAG: protein-L-isoaspartate O-methyltransferase [Hyphomicrobium sp. 32-62-53]|nr:MAG: protein-L-isoaspartate O-methyltransferase [Hyphomicrobium sp. 12-62-95]OYY00849.1 MAG: protein-L-isoaspartate O-methyltransferase [Hyphomicrobium sp. 32-62-53]
MSKRSATRAAREKMVATQLVGRGIRDPGVLDAMRQVQREEFVGPDSEPYAYDDRPLPIGSGQTISQPYIVAFMIEALQLKGGEKVLEIGGGSGYAAAVLARIASAVFTIERIPELAGQARRNLAATAASNVTIRCGDGTQGWPEEAPFDAILVSAGAPDIPAALKSQMKIGGRMVIPVGDEPTSQDLLRVVRTSERDYATEYLTGVRFVPLIGSEGWTPGTA